MAWLKSHEPSARGPSRQHRAVAALLARVKIYYIPHPYGLDSLWFGSIVAWIKCVKFWLACHCFIGICSTRYMFNMRLGESNFGQ